MSSNRFSPLEIDAIGEILNISLGASATAVSTMLSKRVDITTPRVQVLTAEEFKFTNLEPAIGVQITYVAGLEGTNVMLLKRKDVKSIVEILMMTEIPDEEFELNELNLSAICEVMNMMMGASATALSEFLGEVVDISTPEAFSIDDIAGFKNDCFNGEERMVIISFDLKIEDYVESEFMNMMPVKLAKKLVAAFGVPVDEDGDAIESEPATSSGGTMSQEEIEKMLGNTSSEPAASSGGTMSQEEIKKMLGNASSEPATSSGGTMSQEEIEKMLGNAASQPSPAPAASGGKMSQEEIEKLLGNASGGPTPQPIPQPIPQAQPMQQMPVAPDMMQQMIYQQQQMMQQMMQQMIMTQQPYQQQAQSQEPKVINVQPLPVDNLKASRENMGEEQKENLNMILGVPLEVSVEIGRTKKLVKEILELAQGSLVVLDKLAGDQVDLYVNGQCIAKGDVVVVNDNFGIRITEIIKKQELIEGLGK